MGAKPPVKTRPAKEKPRLEDVLRTLRASMPELRERYRVRNLWVFGSYVRGEQRKRSDLDVLVDFDQKPTLLGFVHLERTIAELLGMKVDLVMRTALRPAIGRRILEEIVPV
jgi:predicted nucleotidyltransferase